MDQPVHKAKKATLARLDRRDRRAILARRGHKARKDEMAMAYPDRRATPDPKARREILVLKDRKERRERRVIQGIARVGATDLA